MTVKEYLMQTRDIAIRLETLTEQQKFLRSVGGYTQVQFSKTPVLPRKTHHTEDAYIKLEEKDAQIAAEREKLNEIVAVIEKVSDSTQQAVLSKRYLSRKTWREISYEIHYSIPRVYEIHRDALIAVDDILERHSKT